MNAGALDRQASIEYKNVETNAQYGTEIITWLRLALVSVQVIEPILSRSIAEEVRQGLYVARGQVRIRMRYRPDVTSDMRIVLHGRGEGVVYAIVVGPVMIGRQEGLEMLCETFSSASEETRG